MGPQFSYRGVFVIEYLGPILIVLGYALRPSFLYGPNDGKFDSVAQYERLLVDFENRFKLLQAWHAVLGVALLEARVGDLLRASLQPPHHAADELVQELCLLLGFCLRGAYG